MDNLKRILRIFRDADQYTIMRSITDADMQELVDLNYIATLDSGYWVLTSEGYQALEELE